jgi:hypothetical protein
VTAAAARCRDPLHPRGRAWPRRVAGINDRTPQAVLPCQIPATITMIQQRTSDRALLHRWSADIAETLGIPSVLHGVRFRPHQHRGQRHAMPLTARRQTGTPARPARREHHFGIDAMPRKCIVLPVAFGRPAAVPGSHARSPVRLCTVLWITGLFLCVRLEGRGEPHCRSLHTRSAATGVGSATAAGRSDLHDAWPRRDFKVPATAQCATRSPHCA